MWSVPKALLGACRRLLSAVAPALARAGRLGVRGAERPEFGVGVILFAAVLGLTGGGLGDYLERTLFLQNYFRAANDLGAGPSLDPRLRVIMLDDRSLDIVGRYPTFADWQAIARILVGQGYERVLFGGFARTDDEIGKVEPFDHPGAVLVAGVDSDLRASALLSGDGGLLPRPASLNGSALTLSVFLAPNLSSAPSRRSSPPSMPSAC